MKVYENTD